MAAACRSPSLSTSRLAAHLPTKSTSEVAHFTCLYTSRLQASKAVSRKQERPGVTRSAILGLGAAGGLRTDPSDLRRFKPHENRRHTVSSSRIMAAVPFLPPAFGYVALTAVASMILVQWQVFQVAKQRKKAGIAYPKIYEDKENSVFNCYQRAHQNTLESYPPFLAFLLLSGVAYPITASLLGAVWIIGRVLYSLGYYTGNPNKRHQGSFHWFGYWGLSITSIVVGVKQLNWLPA